MTELEQMRTIFANQTSQLNDLMKFIVQIQQEVAEQSNRISSIEIRLTRIEDIWLYTRHAQVR